jgi:MFS family permease
MSDARQHVGLTAALRGPFGLLWAGQTVSLLGDGAFTVALAWQLAVQWRQPALLGLLLGTRVIAEVATLGLVGFLVDRLRRRTVVLATDAGRALVLFALGATLHRPPPVLSLAALMAAYGVLTALFRPAFAAYIPELVPPDRLTAANALYGISLQAGVMLLGPALGAALVAAGSPTAALQLNGLSFLVAAAAVLPLPARPPAAAGRGGALAGTVEGFRTVLRVGWLAGGVLVISLANLGTIGAERLALPAIAAARYGRLGGYTTIVVATAAGAIMAAWVCGRVRSPREPGRTTYAAALVLGAATLGFGLARGIVAAVLLGLALGAGQQTAELLWTTSLQRNTPARLLGRVMAAAHFGQFLCLPVSFLVGGLVVQAAGPRLVLVVAGANCALLAAAGLAVPALWRWRPFGNGDGAAMVPEGTAAARQRDPRSASLLEGQPS